MHRNLILILLISVFLLAALASAQQKPGEAPRPASHPAAATKPAATAGLPSEEAVNGFLDQMFGYEKPELSWKIQHIKPAPAQGLAEVEVRMQGARGPQDVKFYVTQDGKHAIAGDLLPFGAHPFESTRKELQGAAFGPAEGPANAPVTIVDFSDLQCPHCKDAHPILEKLMSENKNVRLIFQSFPLPSHDWAGKAAGYADCIGRTSNDAFWKFISSVYSSQNDITAGNADEKLTALADQAGVKGADMAACAVKPETTSRVEKSISLGKSVDVTATPTLFINGRPIPGGPPYEVLQKLVAFAQGQQK